MMVKSFTISSDSTQGAHNETSTFINSNFHQRAIILHQIIFIFKNPIFLAFLSFTTKKYTQDLLKCKTSGDIVGKQYLKCEIKKCLAPFWSHNCVELAREEMTDPIHFREILKNLQRDRKEKHFLLMVVVKNNSFN